MRYRYIYNKDKKTKQTQQPKREKKEKRKGGRGGDDKEKDREIDTGGYREWNGEEREKGEEDKQYHFTNV